MGSRLHFSLLRNHYISMRILYRLCGTEAFEAGLRTKNWGVRERKGCARREGGREAGREGEGTLLRRAPTQIFVPLLCLLESILRTFKMAVPDRLKPFQRRP